MSSSYGFKTALNTHVYARALALGARLTLRRVARRHGGAGILPHPEESPIREQLVTREWCRTRRRRLAHDGGRAAPPRRDRARGGQTLELALAPPGAAPGDGLFCAFSPAANNATTATELVVRTEWLRRDTLACVAPRKAAVLGGAPRPRSRRARPTAPATA